MSSLSLLIQTIQKKIVTLQKMRRYTESTLKSSGPNCIVLSQQNIIVVKYPLWTYAEYRFPLSNRNIYKMK